MSERQSSAKRDSKGLAARRRLRRRRAFIVFLIILLFACVGIVYELNQNAVRISRVQIFGADQSLADVAISQMRGSYFGVVPRNSTFFLPESDIRAALFAADSDIAAVSIFRTGLSSVSIKVDTRVPIARWCGFAPAAAENASTTPAEPPTPACYLFDASGFVYATASDAIQPINAFSVYEPLSGRTASSSPLGVTLPNVGKLPAAFDFARQLGTFGSPVMTIVFRADEIDDYLKSGTRITYVLGNEQNAFTALTSASGNLNLADGSIEYVDLRFDGKVYLKKK